MITIPASQFNYQPDTRTFTAEASIMNYAFPDYKNKNGFFVQGKNQTIKFLISGGKKDCDGDLLYTLYTSIDHKQAGLDKPVYVKVFNT